MDVSIVIVNWNTRELLLSCLSSVWETIQGLSFEVYLVDNASSDGSVETVRKRFPDVKIIENSQNLGFAAANNRAFRKMSGKYALLLNSDAELTENAVEKLFEYMETNPDIGAACGQLLNPDDTPQNSIASFPNLPLLLTNETVLRILFPERYPSKRKKYVHPVPVDSCIGACMIVRKKTMDAVGLLDERFFFFFEETDWALRMKRAGWRVCFVPDVYIYHEQGKTAGHSLASRKLYYRSRYRYFRKWKNNLYPLYFAVIFCRLLVNAFLNLMGVVFTLGLSRRLKNRFRMYGGLILWHLRGCP